MRTVNSPVLQFQQISWDHIDLIHDLHSRKEVDQYNTLGIPENKEETHQFISVLIKEWASSTQSIYEWAVFTSDNQFVGVGGLKAPESRFRRGEVFYNILPELWGKGYGTAIAKWLLNFGFNALSLHRIEAGVDCENERSIRVLEKVGMKNEGRRKKILPIRGQWRDNYLYAILESEFEQLS